MTIDLCSGATLKQTYSPAAKRYTVAIRHDHETALLTFCDQVHALATAPKSRMRQTLRQSICNHVLSWTVTKQNFFSCHTLTHSIVRTCSIPWPSPGQRTGIPWPSPGAGGHSEGTHLLGQGSPSPGLSPGPRDGGHPLPRGWASSPVLGDAGSTGLGDGAPAPGLRHAC